MATLQARLTSLAQQIAATIKTRGMPAGGTGGQVLTKNSATAYDAAWITPSGGGLTDGDKGDITVGGGGTSLTIDPRAVTFSKLPEIPNAYFLARTSAGNGDVEAISYFDAATLVSFGLSTFNNVSRGLTPASGGGTTNFLRADGTWAPAGGGASDPHPFLTANEPAAGTTATAGTLRVFGRMMAGRELLGSMDSLGDKITVQPHISRNSIRLWEPYPNVNTLSPGVGLVAPGGLGNTARVTAGTNILTRTVRLGFVSAATAGSSSAMWWTVAPYTIGTGTGLGGFHNIIRFGVSDAAAVSGARMFVGMSNLTAAISSSAMSEPSALTNHIGIAQLSTSTNLHIVYGGSTAQTAIDLGTNFPANVNNELYELQLFASPFNTTVGYRVERLSTGQVASGTLSAASAGVQLPSNTTMLMPRAWRSNNATAAAVGLDIASIYIEVDN